MRPKSRLRPPIWPSFATAKVEVKASTNAAAAWPREAFMRLVEVPIGLEQDRTVNGCAVGGGLARLLSFGDGREGRL